MRHPALSAFALSLLMLAPGAVRWLNADGDAAPPAARVVTVGDMKLTVALDRAQVRAGDRVQLAMVVENPTAHDQRLELEVALLERVGSPMARVMPPPVVRHTERVVVAVTAHATARRVVALAVPAAPKAARGLGRTFTARVTPRDGGRPVALAFVAQPVARGTAAVEAGEIEDAAIAAVEPPTLRPRRAVARPPAPSIVAVPAPAPATPRAAPTGARTAAANAPAVL